MAANWPAIRAGIFAGESGGDYNALFGFSNRPGGRFGNTRLTDMTVDQALAFADPSGPYASYVRGQVGRTATPMGAYQVVGSTLKHAKQGLGLTGNERMTPETQDRIGQWILANQGTGAWAGYKGPRDPSSVKAPPALPGKIGGDSMVARNFDPQVAAATNTPTVFGSIAPTQTADAGTDPVAAKYAFGENKTLGDRLGKLGQAFDDAIPPVPRPSAFPGGPSKDQANAIMAVLKNPAAFSQMLLGKRMA